MALAWTPSVPALIGLSKAPEAGQEQRATGLAAVAGGLAEMFVCGIGAILIGQGTAIFLLRRGFSPGGWMQKLAFRPVDMLERIHAPFRWPLPCGDVVSDPSHVVNHYSWTHSRPPSLY